MWDTVMISIQTSFFDTASSCWVTPVGSGSSLVVVHRNYPGYLQYMDLNTRQAIYPPLAWKLWYYISQCFSFIVQPWVQPWISKKNEQYIKNKAHWFMSKLKTDYVGYIWGKNIEDYWKMFFKRIKTLNSRHGWGKRPSWKTQQSQFTLSLHSPSKIQTHLSYWEGKKVNFVKNKLLWYEKKKFSVFFVFCFRLFYICITKCTPPNHQSLKQAEKC